MQAILVVESGPHLGQRRWIGCNEQLSIGSSAWADFVVESEALQPIHMLLSLSLDGCILHTINDEEFIHGGERKQQACLRNGDVIRIGEFAFRIELDRVPGQGCLLDDALKSRPALPLQSAGISIPQWIACLDHDQDYARFEPTGRQLTADRCVQRIAARMPSFVLCRFDRWSFPRPTELAACGNCVPAAQNSASAAYLPLLVSVGALPTPWPLIAGGLDAGCLMVLATKASHAELLDFLRRTAGLFLSPPAMQTVLRHSQEGAAANLLGPIEGILLGTNSQWEFFGRRTSFPNVQALGFPAKASHVQNGTLRRMDAAHFDAPARTDLLTIQA